MARPSNYTPEIVETICTSLMEGNSLRSTCKKLQIGLATVFEWLKSHEDFQIKYACAREIQGHMMADRVIDTVDQVADGLMDPKAGNVVIGGITWKASKLVPKVYGNFTRQELTGANGKDLNSPLSDAQLAAALNALAHSAPAQHNQPLDDPDDDATDLV